VLLKNKIPVRGRKQQDADTEQALANAG